MKNNKTTIEKILKYIDKIITYTQNTDYNEFMKNSILVEACVFNLGQIGEMANKVDKNFEELYPEIPWRIMYGLRNKIVHDYEGVNLILIWDIISEDLPELRIQLEKIYQEL